MARWRNFPAAKVNYETLLLVRFPSAPSRWRIREEQNVWYRPKADIQAVLKILVDSDEYKCWHEVGHATVCLHLGGDVEFMEFLDGDARGHARTRCIVTSSEIEKTACGGFAAEFYLLKNGYAEQGRDDKKDINRIVFHNATNDREDFWGRKLGTDEAFTEAEDKTFMLHAIGSDGYGGVVPIFNLYLPGMRELVRELLDARRVEGRRVKELLEVGIPR